MRARNTAGFTLIELMIVVSIIAIIAAIAIPKLMSARLSADEASAISTLRSVSSAQSQMQSSAAIDTDADGAGEYGYFGELSGQDPLRVSAAGVPAMGGANDLLLPAILTFPFGNIASSVANRQGYNYQMWLPGLPVAGLTPGIAEAAGGGADPGSLPNANGGEVLWCCYAWPTSHHKTGNRAFFVNQEGELLQCLNRSATPYDGITKMPGFGEAYTANDMGAAMRVGVVGGADATLWTTLQL